MDYIIKEAVKPGDRSFSGRVKEFLNPREFLRRQFSEDYKKISDQVRDIDDSARKKIKGSDSSIQQNIHEARMAFKNREYPRVIYFAWQLINSLENIFDGFGFLVMERELALKNYYGQPGLTQEQIQQMHSALSKKKASFGSKKCKAVPDPNIVSQAGIVEWWKETMPTFRQMEGGIMDRLFRNVAQKQKEASREFLRLAEQAYQSVKNLFVRLESYRTDPDKYIQTIQNALLDFAQLKNRLQTLYQANFPEEQPTQTEKEVVPEAQIPEAPVEKEQPEQKVSSDLKFIALLITGKNE
jgi:hypothetical protein